ncbi:nuclear transport factor 2 family protein [Aquisalinus flavus]|uniref:nuclear transport factor 2 family protein n=1 Tax=Aquisalinus flavus TaxID=1526572 RepID=UPI0019D6CEE8|nr:nuclear transport factor 2 family protein [Aquisalinus flavus]
MDILQAAAALMAAVLPGLPGAGTGANMVDSGADGVRAARAAFNTAIAGGDAGAIAQILAEETVLVAGTNSAVIAGRAEQVAVWTADFADPGRLVYVRKTDKVMLSPLYPMAMETGTWRGAPAGNDTDWVGGAYSAKWRLIDGRWRIEAETYMTTGCGGALCDD